MSSTIFGSILIFASCVVSNLFRQMGELADIVWNEFGQLASIQQSRE